MMSRISKRAKIDKQKLEINRLRQNINIILMWHKDLKEIIKLYQEKENKLERDLEVLKAENYSLKNRGFIRRLLGGLWYENSKNRNKIQNVFKKEEI